MQKKKKENLYNIGESQAGLLLSSLGWVPRCAGADGVPSAATAGPEEGQFVRF